MTQRLQYRSKRGKHTTNTQIRACLDVHVLKLGLFSRPKFPAIMRVTRAKRKRQRNVSCRRKRTEAKSAKEEIARGIHAESQVYSQTEVIVVILYSN